MSEIKREKLLPVRIVETARRLLIPNGPAGAGRTGIGGVALYQQTIAEKVSCTGVGLHSGAPAQLTLHPANANTGIVFVRTDRGTPVEIPARSSEVSSTALATTLGRGAATVGTVEHLQSALYGLGIDNVRIEIDGPELPVMDGSAAPFVYLLRSAGEPPEAERAGTIWYPFHGWEGQKVSGDHHRLRLSC